MTELRGEGVAAPNGAVRALFADLAHGGDMLPAGAGAGGRAESIFSAAAGSREQGTLVRVQLRMAAADGTVREMRYRAFGCPYTLATCEWLARQLSGRALTMLSSTGLTEAVGSAADWCQALGIPAARLGRLLIIEDALCAALQAAAASLGCEADRSCSPALTIHDR